MSSDENHIEIQSGYETHFKTGGREEPHESPSI